MAFEIEYFHERVLSEIQSWPVDVLADYACLVELLAEHGPDLRLPHSRALGEGLFELRPRGQRWRRKSEHGDEWKLCPESGPEKRACQEQRA